MMATYAYQPLSREAQEIRLITLLPGSFNDEIRLQLFHVSLMPPPPRKSTKMALGDIQKTLPADMRVYETTSGRYLFAHDDTPDTSWSHPDPAMERSLDDAPSPTDALHEYKPVYEALSYTWGDKSSDAVAFVEDEVRTADGDSHSTSTLQLRPNLTSALRHLRLPKERRTLWIDALCINQQDLAERGSQVSRMGEIFGLAHRVIAWLGSENDNSTLALEATQHLGRQVEFVLRPFRGGLRSPSCCEPDLIYPQNDLPYADELWRALEHLMARPWFGRAWIMQEVLLANDRAVLQCGHHQIPWRLFSNAAFCIMQKMRLPSQSIQEAFRILGGWITNGRGTSFFRLLHFTRRQACSEPADKIFSIRSLAPQSYIPLITPDYSTPVSQVYKHAFLTYLEKENDLLLLTGCSLSERKIDVPSWVPDWSVPQVATFTFAHRFNACGSAYPIVKYVGPAVLKVIGVHCGTLRTVSRAAVDGVDLCNLIAESKPSDAEKQGDMPCEDFLETCLKGLGTDFGKERWFFDRTLPTSQQFKEACLQSMAADNKEIEGSLSDDKLDPIFKYFKHRAYFQTERRFGLGPPAARPDDIVCVLLGSGAPLLLRPHLNGRYQVVGECYVCGLMDSEGILGPLAKPWTTHPTIYDSQHVRHLYVDSANGRVTSEDPRLGRLPEDWECIDQDECQQVTLPLPEGRDPVRKAAEKFQFQPRFRHKETGLETQFDPRLEPDALRARGVDLRTFSLI